MAEAGNDRWVVGGFLGQRGLADAAGALDQHGGGVSRGGEGGDDRSMSSERPKQRSGTGMGVPSGGTAGPEPRRSRNSASVWVILAFRSWGLTSWK